MRTNKDCWIKNTLSYKYPIMRLVVCLAVGILLIPVMSECSQADGEVAGQRWPDADSRNTCQLRHGHHSRHKQAGTDRSHPGPGKRC